MFNLVADATAAICVLAMLGAIVFNFLNTSRDRFFRERRSPVATASMVGFFLLLYFTIRFRWGALGAEGMVTFRSLGWF